MATADCLHCGGSGRCQRCKKNTIGHLDDDSDCECTYGETGTLGECIYCGGTGDTEGAPDLHFVQNLLEEKGRHTAAKGIQMNGPPPLQLVNMDDLGPLPDPEHIDWDALMQELDDQP